MKGDIVLVPFPNSDLSTQKRRPALILYEDPIEKETTIAYISSRIPIVPSPSDVLIMRGTPSYDESGLKWDSAVKLNKIATIKTHFIVGLLGTADESLKAEVNKALDACLMFPTSPQIDFKAGSPSGLRSSSTENCTPHRISLCPFRPGDVLSLLRLLICRGRT